MSSQRALPAAAALSATVAWGVMFPVLSAVLGRLDLFQASAERYVIAAAALLAILVVREGPRALRLAGNARAVMLLGLAGFTGFNLLLCFGVRWAGPQHGALIMATTPALAMVAQAVRTRVAPPVARIPLVVAAFAGVALVVIAGHGVHAGSTIGDLAMIGAVLCWVTYTLGAGAIEGWSPLRFGALTAAAGAVGLVVAAIAAVLAGISRAPSFADYAATAPSMAYLALVGGVFGIFAWTFAVRGLGSQRVALFMNIVPVAAFVATAVLGSRPAPLEVGGAALTILALIGDNLLAARSARAPAPALAEAA